MRLSPKQKQFVVLTGLGLLVAAATASYFDFIHRKNTKNSEDFRRVRYLPPQPLFTTAPIKPVRKALKSLNPAEMVLGVIIRGKARAYPLNVLNELPDRKIFNDDLGGKAIAVTWCDRCHMGLVFEREVDGKPLTFGISGDLWQENMVMYDYETKSLWSQALGEAKRGHWKGKKLKQVPSFLTDWRSWSKQYPLGTVLVLKRTRQEFTRDLYQHQNRFLLGIAEGKTAKSWNFEDLRRQGCINDQWQGRPVLAVLEPASATARLFERTVSGRILTFRFLEEKLVDENTASTWSPVTGQALSGPLADQHLRPLAATVAFRNSWRQFHR